MTKHAASHLSHALRDERGFTLIEMLVAIPLMLIVFIAVFNLYDVSVREQSRGEARVRGIVDQKNGLERMSRELRDAVSVRYQTSEVIDAQISSAGRWLRYDCSGTSCKRYEGPSQGTFDTGPVTLIDNVHSAEFQTLADVGGTLTPDFVNPTYVSVTLRVSVKDASNPIVLSDGFNLRNLTTPQ
jgi:prepilin-type N-terminal cleavage/methylation domain-containing protein